MFDWMEFISLEGLLVAQKGDWEKAQKVKGYERAFHSFMVHRFKHGESSDGLVLFPSQVIHGARCGKRPNLNNYGVCPTCVS